MNTSVTDISLSPGGTGLLGYASVSKGAEETALYS